MKILKIFFSIIVIFYLNSCGVWRPADARKVPVNADDRVQKNIQEGRGFRIKNLGNNNSGNFEFATSNEMWRASLDILDFVPLSNVDYSGGIIITDWYLDEKNLNESIKITIRFLSNEIRADGLNINVHKKICSDNLGCKIKKVESGIIKELKIAILKEASILQKNERKTEPNYKKPVKGY
jgi:hypothetical protein